MNIPTRQPSSSYPQPCGAQSCTGSLLQPVTGVYLVTGLLFTWGYNVRCRANLMSCTPHLTHLSGPLLALLTRHVPTAGSRAGCLCLATAGRNIILYLVFLLLGPAFWLVDCSAHLRTSGIAVLNKRISTDLGIKFSNFLELLCKRKFGLTHDVSSESNGLI